MLKNSLSANCEEAPAGRVHSENDFHGPIILRTRTAEAPFPSLGLVKLDFLLGTKSGFNARSKQEAARTSSKTSLSGRRIKTLPISPYSSKIWRENPEKVLIPKDRPWEGGPRHYPVNTRQPENPKKPVAPTCPENNYFLANKRRR